MNGDLDSAIERVSWGLGGLGLAVGVGVGVGGMKGRGEEGERGGSGKCEVMLKKGGRTSVKGKGEEGEERRGVEW